MNIEAWILMIVAMLILWGGLGVAITSLIVHDRRTNNERR